jgi:hypothetical protein
VLFEWQTCSKVGNYQRAATTTRLECIHQLYCSRGLNFRATASNHFNHMGATINHPAFVQPSDFSAKIWRYVDFAKFVSFLDSSNLYLARLDQMPDPFEGSLSNGVQGVAGSNPAVPITTIQSPTSTYGVGLFCIAELLLRCLLRLAGLSVILRP